MIKIERGFTPSFFSPERITSLTSTFINEGKAVWQHQEVKSALLSISNNKCAYCECKLEEESKYLEVEHFKDKDTYPQDVIKWENLLPSCKHCNVSKGRHDVVVEPIVNPCDDEPVAHFILKNYRLCGTSDLGRETIDVLDLNNTNKNVFKRFEVGEIIHNQLDSVRLYYNEYIQNPTPRKLRILQRKLKAIIEICQKTSSYSAVASTMLQCNDDYIFLRNAFLGLNIWDEECIVLDENSILLRLQTA